MINITDHIDVSVRYEVLRSGSVYKQIYADGTPVITMQADSELKTSMSGSFHAYTDVDFLTDKLRVIVNLNGEEYPCGTYCVTSEVKRKADGAHYIEIEGYSLLYIVQRAKTGTRLSFAAGELYTDVIEGLLIEAGITAHNITASGLAFATDREDWEIGTSLLTIVNQLLQEISYNTAYADNQGNIVCEPFTESTFANVDFTYKADEHSIVGPDYSIANDYHSKYNVFKVICSNPDLPVPLSATAVNNIGSSPFNVDKIGRVLQMTHIDNIASQAALQLKADILRMKSMLSSEVVTFETVINPEHSVFNIIALNNNTLSGIYAETSWTMQLSASAMMMHKARRALYD